jgi:Tol biopolymer transport system component
MTSPRRFEQALPALLADLYVGGMPDYRDDLLRSTAATRQRPAWSFPTRWLPMDLTIRRLPMVSAPWRLIGVALLILALIATTLLLTVGSQRRVPPPFGPARNGSIIASTNGDLFVRDAATGQSRLVLGGTEADSEPGFSPDGSLMAFIRATDDRPYLTVADLDGTHVRRVLDTPLDEHSWAQWAPDSRHLGVVMLIDGRNRFVLASTEGNPLQVADMGDLIPFEFQFRPPDGREIAVRASDHGRVDVYLMHVDGTNLRKLGLHSNSALGWDWDLRGISWSPSGNQLGYNASDRDPASGVDHFRVHVLTIATMKDEVSPSPSDPKIHQAWPMWSPDGTKILVQRFTWEQGWLAILPADGSTGVREVGRKFGGPDSQMDQGWSPDGTKILLRFDDDHFYEIDVATGRDSPLTWPLDKIPDWQRLAP